SRWPAAACRRRWIISRPSRPGPARTERLNWRPGGSVLPGRERRPVGVALREKIPEIVAALPLGGRRRALPRTGHVGRGQRLLEPRQVARAVRVDLALDAHDELRTVMAGDDLRVVDDRRPAVDAHPQRLAVEAQEEQAHVGIPGDVAEGAVHRVAVVLRELDDIVPDDPDESRVTGLDAAVDVLAPGRGDEEKRRGLDELSIAVPEDVMAAVALERIGDPAPVEA